METELETLKKYGNEFQNKCLTCLLTDRLFLERIFDILLPEYFESSAQKWLVEQIKDYYINFRDHPTAMVLSLKLQEIDSQMKLMKQSVGDLLGIVYDHMTDPDLQFVKEQFLEFCKARALAKAILESVDHLNKGDYDAIKVTVDNALKAGMERDLGHDYLVDIDKRMSQTARDCIKTGWDIIDQLMDGGLGRGELGFVVAPSGAGKCVGPNTRIEIQYDEIGIPIRGNLGGEYVLWINPLSRYDLGKELGILYGWEIELILSGTGKGA